MRNWLMWRTIFNRTTFFTTSSTESQTAFSHVTSSRNQYITRKMSTESDKQVSNKDISSRTLVDDAGSAGRRSPKETASGGGTAASSSASTADGIANESLTATTDVPGSDQNTPKSTGGRVTRQNIRKHEEISEVKEKYLSMNLEAKRKLYKGSFVTLGKIKAWPDYFTEELKTKLDLSTLEKEKEVREDLNQKVSLFRGDLTSLEIDAIVNAANESLLGGGGVDGAIHRAAGPHLRSECETLHGCQPGQAKITCGYNLAAKYVIHTVGPRGEQAKVLNKCYTNSLDLVKEHKLTSVAFPCISTGIFGYPNINAAKVAISAVRQWLEKEEYAKQVERVIFCLFLQVDVDAYEKLMPLYFPVENTTDSNTNQSPYFEKLDIQDSASPSSEDTKCDSKEGSETRKD